MNKALKDQLLQMTKEYDGKEKGFIYLECNGDKHSGVGKLNFVNGIYFAYKLIDNIMNQSGTTFESVIDHIVDLNASLGKQASESKDILEAQNGKF